MTLIINNVMWYNYEQLDAHVNEKQQFTKYGKQMQS